MTQAQPGRLSAGVIINIGLIVLGVIAITLLLVARLVSDDPASSTEPLDLSVRLEAVAEGLEAPVLLVGADDRSDDRYVVEQVGRVRRLAPDGKVDPEPLLDITDRVLHQHERGLLGLAFHPEIAENGRFFVAYSRSGDGATSISEFTVPPEGDAEAVSVESSERALLTIPQPYTTHKGGMLAFDHDGMLLAGVGDGGSMDDPQKQGQDRASLLGKLLRIDVDRGWPYATPEDNGFSDDPRAKAEIHAVGLRNPWRFSVDRESGDVYIGDVGQREWEEINVLPPGSREASFGWSEMEGRECFDDDCEPEAHIPPAIAYPHAEGETGHCAVIGGYAYRGVAGSLPDGTYLYADYCSGTVWAVPAEQLRADKAAPAVVGQVPIEYGQATAFGEDDAGELYLLTDAGYVLGISETERS